LARRLYGGIIKILRRLSEPPGRRRWPPEGGSASLESMGGGVHDGIGALPDGIGLCPLATVPASLGTEELARRLCGGLVRILRRLSEPPGGRREGGPAFLEAMGGGVHDGIGALPDGIGLCPLATPPARAGHGGTCSPPVRGHRLNFTKALRAVGRAPVSSGGWPGLSGGHRRRGARLNRGVARSRPCPQGLGTVELARRLCGGIVRILRRLFEPPGGRRWPPEGGPASLEAMGGGVHDGIGALPDGIGLCLPATVPARAGHGGGAVELARRPCGGIVRILRRLSEPPVASGGWLGPSGGQGRCPTE